MLKIDCYSTSSLSGMEGSHEIVQVYQISIFKITPKDKSNGQAIQRINHPPPPQKKNVKGGKANQGVPRDFSISYSDELEFQSNFNLQVGLVQFHILLHHCQG